MYYTLLRRENWQPRPSSSIHYLDINEPLIALDIETTGLDPFTDTIVGIAIAGNFGNAFYDVREPAALHNILSWLRYQKWTAYNTMFDGAFIIKAQQQLFGGAYHQYTPAIAGDAMVAFKMAANEGWPGQRYTLQTAIEDVLGWESNQKDTLGELLAKHGLGKGDMSKLMELEPEAFALYGAMDAEAAWQLEAFFEDLREGFPAMKESYAHYTTLVQLAIEQRLRGITIDRSSLEALNSDLERSMHQLEVEFRNMPQISSYLANYEQVEGTRSEEKTREHWVRAKKQDQPWLYPDLWQPFAVEEPKAWELEHGAWRRKVVEVKLTSRKVKEVKFNIQSKQQLVKLFYDHLGYTPTEQTEKGFPKIDKKVLPSLGEAGKVLAEYNKKLKLHGYVTKLLERSITGRLHYDLRIHGTMTGRSAGAGGLNIQQLAKDEAYLKCFRAAEGYSLIDTDFNSLENVVLAELSRDPGLLELYASGKPHDAYLFTACHVFPDAGIKEVYKPENPTKESVAEAKKLFKKYRSIAKIVVLSSNYGASPKKIHSSLNQSGVEISLREVEEIHRKYWELFAGIKRYGKSLEREWKSREGYILNGLGRPICIPEDQLKDIVNRDCQSTGVGMLHKLLFFIDKMRRERKVPMYPWICDFHDQTVWEVKCGHEEQAKLIYAEAYARLNEDLRPLIPLVGSSEISDNLWDFKK